IRISRSSSASTTQGRRTATGRPGGESSISISTLVASALLMSGVGKHAACRTSTTGEARETDARTGGYTRRGVAICQPWRSAPVGGQSAPDGSLGPRPPALELAVERLAVEAEGPRSERLVAAERLQHAQDVAPLDFFQGRQLRRVLARQHDVRAAVGADTIRQ